jgi:mono/diheme cytochrome c family protein
MSDPARRRPCVSAAAIWLASLLTAPAGSQADEAGRTAAHPIVPGFERFGADPKADPVEGGLLLMGELGCASCHRAEGGAADHVGRKQAPVLDGVGSRVRPAYLRAFLADPRGVKPGTTMPDPFAGWPAGERAEAVEALTHLLASTGGLAHARPRLGRVASGSVTYRFVGCIACHGPRDGRTAAAAAVPLGDLAAKYTIPGLAAFLHDPLHARPSGRMPDLRLTPTEARAVAEYLMKDLKDDPRPNLEYGCYEGDWERLPDFETLKPVRTGKAEGFDLSVARRQDNMAIQYRGTFRVDRDGEYAFRVTSDDGSKLWVDGTPVVDNDGIHGSHTKSGVMRLEKGSHGLRVDYFNDSAGTELDVRLSGPGLDSQPLEGFLTPLDPAAAAEDDRDRLAADPGLVEKGKGLFARVGCASCHQLRVDDAPLAPSRVARPLAAIDGRGGCLGESPAKGTPDYGLNDRQRAAIAAALGALPRLAAREPTRDRMIARTMTALNCYACHQRDGRGGVESALNPHFETTQREMGDEGRIPPPLDGVGAKLNESYLTEALANGLKDRPYMRTRMPRFGLPNATPLAKALAAVDHVDPVPVPGFDETSRKVKSTGRFLVGGEALGCVKCHTFNGSEAEGVQAIDLTILTRRLRRDWFHRYVVNPPAFRPGTRMPTGWPDGKSMLPKVLDGDALRQVEAVWRFLSDGRSAAEPYGLGRQPLPLFAVDGAVMYRNFLKGAGPRAIGVGYPERANLAFDANDLRLALIWQQGFIDASRHWSGRGEGFQAPMGDNVVALPAGVAFATLSSPSQAWPSRSARQLGYAFRGYRLDPGGRPTFLYDLAGARVEDRPEAVAGPKGAGLTRTLTLTATADPPPEGLWFRAAVGDTVRPAGGGWYLVNDEWKVRVASRGAPVVRPANDMNELIVPVEFEGKVATIVEHFDW